MIKFLKHIKWKRYVNYFLVGIALIVTAILYAADGQSPTMLQYTSVMTQIGYSIILAVSLNMVVGFLGELSLGHAGFMCVGAYIGGVVVNMLSAVEGFPKLLVTVIAMLVGGLAAALMGFLIGLPTLHLKGDYLAIVTLGFGEIVRNLFANLFPDVFGGPSGLSVTKYGRELCIVALAVAFIMLIVVQNMMRGKHGRAIQSIRDNEIAARASGVPVVYYKMLAFVMAAFFAGIAGVLFGQRVGILRPTKFDFNYSINILVMVVLGGMGNITGSILSAAALTILDIKLTEVLSGDLAVIKNLIYALILIIIVVWNNAPRLKPIRDRYNLGALWRWIQRRVFRIKTDKEPFHVAGSETAAWDRIPTKIPMDSVLSADLNPNAAFTPDKPNRKGD